MSQGEMGCERLEWEWEDQRWAGSSVVREGWRVATRCVSIERFLVRSLSAPDVL